MGVVSAATTAISVTAPFIIAVIVAAVISVASLAVVFSFFVFCAAAISAGTSGVTAISAGLSASLPFFAGPHPLAFSSQDFRPALYFADEVAEGGGNFFAGHPPPKLLGEVFDLSMKDFIYDVRFVKAGSATERFRLVDFRLQTDGQLGMR